MHLGGLDTRAAKQTVNRCFNTFGVEGGAPWREAILDRAVNWPQHLAVYLNAAISQIHEASPDRMDARRADLPAAMRLGDRSRTKYYSQRFARLTRRNMGFGDLARRLAPMVRGREPGYPAADLLNVVRSMNPDASDVDITKFFEDAQHSGFLALNVDEAAYSMPISTFAGHLLGEPLPDLDDPAPADEVEPQPQEL